MKIYKLGRRAKGIFHHEKELILSGENRAKIYSEGKKACPKAKQHMKGA